MNESTSGKRARNEGALERSRLKVALSAIVDEIGDWQRQSVVIDALAGRDAPIVIQRKRDLLSKVVDGQARFEALAAELPDGLRAHSRVTDLRRTLEQLRSRLN